jgi:hypothetical protein
MLYTSKFTCRAVTTDDVQQVCKNTAMGSHLRKFFLAFVAENFADPVRLRGTTGEWDELLLDHSDAGSFLLKSYRTVSGERKFVKDEWWYLDQPELLLRAFGGLAIE